MKRRKPKANVIVQGWDISLNHGAVVQLCNGELDGFWYYTNLAGSAARSKEHGFRIEMPTPTKQPDKQIRSAIRLDWVSRWLDRVALSKRPQFACLEDYALGADQGAHYIGEIGGQARRLLWLRGVRFRLYDPITVKMFVTNDGTAQKDLVEEFVEKRWGVEFGDYNAKPGKNGKENRTTSEDLADAFGMAQMAWTEYQLRKGLIRMKSLGEKQIQVFQRVTKVYPINILGREWIHNPEGVFASQRYEACTGGQCALRVLDQRGLLSEQAQRGVAKAVRRESK